MPRIDLNQHPPFAHPDYRSSLLRGPKKHPLNLSEFYEKSTIAKAGEFTGCLTNRFVVNELENDLIRNSQQGGAPLGERIIVSGQVLNQWGKPEPGVLIEIWQANASGRYIHKADKQEAPLDPNFLGVGRCITDNDGNYRFYSIKPGAYPWKNHPNAWRPQHIHFSLIGESIADRLVTQMYFPGDPLLSHDPIFLSVPTNMQERLISTFDTSITEADFALGYHFDIVLAGAKATPTEAKENI